MICRTLIRYQQLLPFTSLQLLHTCNIRYQDNDVNYGPLQLVESIKFSNILENYCGLRAPKPQKTYAQRRDLDETSQELSGHDPLLAFKCRVRSCHLPQLRQQQLHIHQLVFWILTIHFNPFFGRNKHLCWLKFGLMTKVSGKPSTSRRYFQSP